MIECPPAPASRISLPAHIFNAEAPPRRYPERFTVKSEGSYIFLRFSDVDWVGAQGDYVKFHAGRQSCLTRMTMKTVEENFDPAIFLRIHRSTFVNIERIEKISPFRERQYAVVLKDGTRLRIGGAYRARIREFYESAFSGVLG